MKHHQGAPNHQSSSEVVCGCTKPRVPSDPVCLQAFCSSAPSLLLHFYLSSKSISYFFFLSVTPELWHFKGSAAEEPVADFLRRSLDWAMPPIWLYLGPSGKTIWGCHASPSVKGKDKCSDKHHENIQESQQACINPNFISISIFIGGHRAVLMGFGCRFKQPKGTKNSD